MSAETILRALAAGAPIAADALLPTCRAAAFGADLYGGEAIVEAFRSQPIVGEARFTAAPGHAALIGTDHALIADVAEGGHIARMWRLGPDTPIVREHAVSVAFDVDMTQMPSAVRFAASDHPALAPDDAERVVAAGLLLADDWHDADDHPSARARAFCVRAFTAGETVVALFAVHVMNGRGERRAGFVNAMTVTERGKTLAIRDWASDAAMRTTPWRPRIG